MCTYNGGAYLKEQLNSFDDQTFSNWTLYVSDDASTDETLDLLARYQLRWGANRLIIFNGPCNGFAENFISLIRRPEVKGDYFAFSDQDDVWFKDKLARSVNRLEQLGNKVPTLYCSVTRLVDADRNVIGVSKFFNRPLSFQNALVQSIAGANTMLINTVTRELLLQLPDCAPLIAHDWLTYLLVTGAGGYVAYEPEPSLDYRQHSGNLIGANASFRDRLNRLQKMLSGRFIKWNDANLTILKALESSLTIENRQVLAHFDCGRRQRFFKRLAAFRRAGIYRQTLPGNLSLLLAACLGRI
ncbi:glycosyltransferase family 2 protein [Pseudomonas alliivorans]|nr:glycosyltransferase family 2 protein [Pseudomonas alliivorans]